MNNQPELNQKIKQIEQSIQSTKTTLKSWANSIGKYHQALKELSCQLATFKKQININMNKINNNKNQGVTK